MKMSKTKEEREIAYDYGYHERIYNDADYIELLSSIGFNVKVVISLKNTKVTD